MKKDEVGVGDIKSRGKILKDPLAKAEALNQQFSSVLTFEDVTNIPTLGANSDIPSIASLVINLIWVEQQLHSLIKDKASLPYQRILGCSKWLQLRLHRFKQTFSRHP